MSISFTIANDNAELVLNDIRSLFPQLAGALPPMQEQPIREPAPPVNDNGTAVTNTPRPGDKPGSRTRKPKEDAKADAGESSATAESSAPETKSATDTSAASQSGSAADASPSEIPDIEVVRAKLKQMGATDGLGHDKVFETLAHYKSKDDDKQPAKSASTLKPSDYIALIAEIDGLLASVSK